MNENCLIGLRCPKCGQEEPLQIRASTWVTMYDDSSGECTELDWDDSSEIICDGCNASGTVGEFRMGDQS